MNGGKWYFVYTLLDHSMRSKPSEEVPLNAGTEDEAIVEGQRKWAEILANNRFVEGPWSPRVIYKMMLKG